MPKFLPKPMLVKTEFCKATCGSKPRHVTRLGHYSTKTNDVPPPLVGLALAWSTARTHHGQLPDLFSKGNLLGMQGPLVVVLVTLATVGLPPWSGDAVPMSDAGDRNAGLRGPHSLRAPAHRDGTHSYRLTVFAPVVAMIHQLRQPACGAVVELIVVIGNWGGFGSCVMPGLTNTVGP